ncbi:uncharacterized protein LOC142087876 [Calonectris borealis]|uniref:uncharacterized protein LOC142087876 n=1 Tax=Calonectris borealis TaxID=1323832 RepID=UPI003F4B0730
MAGRRQTMPKMPMDEEAKEHAQPANRLPSLQKRRQVGRREPQAAPQGSQSRASSRHGDRLPRLPCPESSQTAGSRRAQLLLQTDSLVHRVALPCNRVTTQEDTARLPALPPLPRQAAAPGHAPAAWPPGAARACSKLLSLPRQEVAAGHAPRHAPAALPPRAARTCCKLSPLPAAPRASACMETASSTTGSSRQQLGPSSWGIRSDQGTAARMESWSPAPHRPTAHAAAVREAARCLVSEVMSKVLTGSRGPSQQPAAQQNRAQSTAVVMTARTDEVWVADGGQAPAAQPAPDPHACEGTSAAGRAPAPASPGRDAGLDLQGQATEHDPGTLPARVKSCVNSRLLWARYLGVVAYVPILSTKTEPPEELERSCLARTGQQQDGPKESELQQQESKEQRFSPTRSGRLNARARQEKPGALAEEEEEWEDNSDKELSQGEDITISSPRVKPLVPELFQDPHAGPQEGPGWPSSTGAEAAGEAAGNLRSMSPAPAGLLDAEPAASALAGAPEEEGQRTPLAPAEQEEAKASASPVWGEQATAAQAESQAPAPHSPTASDTALLDTVQYIAREVVRRAVAVIQGPGQQPAEEQDPVQSTDAAMAARTPAAPQDTESPSAGDHQGETSTAVVSPAAHEEAVASSWPQNPPAVAGTPHLAPAEDKGGGAAASPLARDLRHQVVVESDKVSPRPPFLQAESQAPAPHSPTASDTALLDTVQYIAREVVRRAVVVIQGPGQQPAEEQDLVRSTDAAMAARTPAAPQDTESPSAGDHQGETSTAVVSPAAHEEAVASSWPQNPPAVAGTPHLAPAEDKGGGAAASPLARDLRHQVVVESDKVSPRPPFLQAESQAPAPHSPTASDTALLDTVQYIAREVVRRAVVVIQGPGQQPAEEQDLVQRTDSAMAARTPAAPQDTESPSAGDHQGETSTAVVSPAAHEEAVASSWPQNPPAVAGTPHLAPAEDKGGGAAASPLAQDLRHQAESQAPAPHSPTASDTALLDTVQYIAREVVRRAVVVIQGPGQQPAEEQDLVRSTDAAMAARTPAAPQDTESPSAGDHQGETSTAVVSPAAHEEAVASSWPQNPLAVAGTPHLAPAEDKGGGAAASPLARDLRHQVAPKHRGDAQLSSGCRDVPQDDPGIAALPHTLARQRRPSLFRRALRALRRALHCNCIAGQQE